MKSLLIIKAIILIAVIVIISLSSCTTRHDTEIADADTLHFPVDSVGRVIQYKSTNLETGSVQLVQYHQPKHLKELVFMPGDSVYVTYEGEVDNNAEFSMLHKLDKVLH